MIDERRERLPGGRRAGPFIRPPRGRPGARRGLRVGVLVQVQEEPQPYARLAGIPGRTVVRRDCAPRGEQLLDGERGLVIGGSDLHHGQAMSYLPDLEAYLADLLRNRERLAAFATADDWAKSEAMPSDQEIIRLRRLIKRVREDLDSLKEEDRAEIQQAVSIIRRSWQTVSLGMPRVGQPLPDFRLERPA